MGRAEGSSLAVLLRELRTRHAWGQKDLAVRAGLSVRTIRDLERGRVSRPQPATMRLLVSALELSGEHRHVFLDSVRPETSGPGGLPRRELIGRAEEVDELSALLDDVSVLTLVGVAGVGKTTLALGVGHRYAEQRGLQAALVTVPRFCTTEDLRTAVTAALGGTDASRLASHLRDRGTLLVLDGAEAASDAAADVAGWLHDMPGVLRILVTSRRPLGIADEYRRTVAPLPVPPADGTADAASADRYPASRLFLERIRRIRAEPIAEHEMPVLATLVRRLGGHPLAIELMAARTRMLGLRDIARRYGPQPLDMTAAGRGGNAEPADLRAIIADSYRVLGAEEQRTLRELSVFEGSWRVDTAERLVSADDPLTVLDRLAEHGMVTAVEDEWTGRRFRLLDVVRDYASEQLTVSGDEGWIRARHASLCDDVVRQISPLLSGVTTGQALRRLDEEIADLNVALHWAGSADPLLALSIASGLGRYWSTRGTPGHGREWMDRLLADPACVGPGPVRLRGLIATCVLASKDRAVTAALDAGRQALELAGELSDTDAELAARAPLTRLLRLRGRYDEARENARSALRLAERSGDLHAQIREQTNLVWDDIRTANLADARDAVRGLRRRAQRLNDPILSAVLDLQLAEIETLDARFPAAERLIGSALRRARTLDAPDRVGAALCALVLVRSIDQRPASARAALAEVRALADRLGLAWLSGLVRQSAGFLALAEGDLGAARGHFRALLRTPRYDYRNEIESRIGLLVAEREDPARCQVRLRELRDACLRLQVRLCPSEVRTLTYHGVDVGDLPTGTAP